MTGPDGVDPADRAAAVEAGERDGLQPWPDLLPAPRPGGRAADPAVGRGTARGRARAVEATLLVVAGFSLVLATLVDTPWVSVLTLPAALLGPGHVLLRVAAARLTAEPWFAWALRVLLSLAVWTLLGAVFAITPGLDPRVVPLLVGPVLVLVGLAAPAGSDRQPLLSRPAAEADDPDPAEAGSGGPGGGGLGSGARGPVVQDPRTLAGRLVTVLVMAVVAAGSLYAGYRIVVGAPAGPGYLAVALTPPQQAPYDERGRLTSAVQVRNGTGRAVRVRLELQLDGRGLPAVPVGTVEAGGAASAGLAAVRTPACWSRLTVTLVGDDLGAAAPRPLVLQGPRGALASCPAAP